MESGFSESGSAVESRRMESGAWGVVRGAWEDVSG
jgi:hypothetical protein